VCDEADGGVIALDVLISTVALIVVFCSGSNVFSPY